MTRYQVPREETSINLTNNSEQVYSSYRCCFFNLQWEAFTVPELQNFLRILDKEEEDYIRQVRRKYVRYQAILQEAADGASKDQVQPKAQTKPKSQIQTQSPVHIVQASA